jgi:hypothetical protein
LTATALDKSIWIHSPPAESDPEYNPVPESYNPVPELQLVEADKSNAYSGFAPEDEVAETMGVKTLLTSPTTVDNNVQVVPSVDEATAVGDP